MITLAHPAWLLLTPLLFLAVWRAARKNSDEDNIASAQLVLVHPDLSPLPYDKNAQKTTSHGYLLLNSSALLLLVLALLLLTHTQMNQDALISKCSTESAMRW